MNEVALDLLGRAHFDFQTLADVMTIIAALCRMTLLALRRCAECFRPMFAIPTLAVA